MIKEEAMVLSMTEKVMAKELAMVWSKMEKVLVWSMKGTAFVGAAYFQLRKHIGGAVGWFF